MESIVVLKIFLKDYLKKIKGIIVSVSESPEQ